MRRRLVLQMGGHLHGTIEIDATCAATDTTCPDSPSLLAAPRLTEPILSHFQELT